MKQDAKKRKLLLATLALALVCFAVLSFLYDRNAPEPATALQQPAKPKLTRPKRTNTARTEQAKKMVAKTEAGKAANTKTHGCLLKNEYDEATGILRVEVDTNCDGTVDQCLVKQLNEYGEPVRIESNKDCEKDEQGRCTQIEYNEYGEEIAYNYDTDCDGDIDRCLSLIRNEHGDVVEDFFDKNCNGVLDEKDWHHCYTLTYDEDGLPLTHQGDACGEEPEYCASFEYDLERGTQRVKFDANCDGTVDSCQVMLYRDGYSNPDSFMENDCDGTWKSCNLFGDVDWVVQTFEDRNYCVQKFEEFIKTAN